MKKILVLALVCMLLTSSFVFAASGGNDKGNAIGLQSAPGLQPTLDFDSNDDLLGFVIDRIAPASYSIFDLSGESVLKQEIDSTNRADEFYKFNGLKYDVTQASKVSIDLYIPSEWADIGHQTATFWARATNEANEEIIYPILGFTSVDYDDDGINDPGFTFWPQNNEVGYWSAPILPENFQYNAWYTLTLKIEEGVIVMSVDNMKYHVNLTNEWSIEEWPELYETTHFSHIFLQGYNALDATDYTIYWDNLVIK